MCHYHQDSSPWLCTAGACGCFSGAVPEILQTTETLRRGLELDRSGDARIRLPTRFERCRKIMQARQHWLFETNRLYEFVEAYDFKDEYRFLKRERAVTAVVSVAARPSSGMCKPPACHHQASQSTNVAAVTAALDLNCRLQQACSKTMPNAIAGLCSPTRAARQAWKTPFIHNEQLGWLIRSRRSYLPPAFSVLKRQPRSNGNPTCRNQTLIQDCLGRFAFHIAFSLF